MTFGLPGRGQPLLGRDGMAKRQGMMIVLSSPSGGGKTVVSQRLLRGDKNIVRSVSCTTRPRRPGERSGRDYVFLSPARFKRLASRKGFLEWARVHGHDYGTPRRWVEGQLKKGKDVLLVIDVQGGKSVRRRAENTLLIFIVPPCFSVLRRRLLGRNSDDAAAIQLRLKNARWEMKQGRDYDYRVVNDKLDRTVSEVAGIIRRERESRTPGANRKARLSKGR
jgi:guanylate kinase